jgi:transcription initiation factor TFIIE subunit alpha
MKLTLEIIEELVKQIAGSDTTKLIPLLYNKKNVSEFLLAEKLGVNVNIVRNMLYRLYGYNLVGSVRKKDKKKGWYIYYWTLNPLRVRDLIVSMKKKKLEALKKRLSQEEGAPFFICNNKCIRIDFNIAMEHDFKCPECGELMQEDRLSNVDKIKSEIVEIEKELEEGYEIELPKEPKKRKKKKVKKKKKKVSKKKKIKKVSKKKVKKKTRKKVLRKKPKRGVSKKKKLKKRK